ncbi:MAG: enoyl-ACP reductase [Pseudomonadota bacterium]
MAELLKGKRGLITGIANNRSLAYGIAKAMREEGAELAFAAQLDIFGAKVAPIADELGVDLVCDYSATDDAVSKACFDKLGEAWGGLDFCVHAIAFSDKAELTGSFTNTSRANFKNSLDISAYSLIDMARNAAPLMQDGGSIMALTYQGSKRATPWYNVMGVAKAALETTALYLANDLGPQGIRVNCISPGPMKTLSGAAIGGARKTFRFTEANAPLRRNATLEAIGGTAVYLASDYSTCTTGECIMVDGGYHILGMPQPEHL